jgi:acetyltransferase-like isoleucine patch superfamily enzyme
MNSDSSITNSLYTADEAKALGLRSLGADVRIHRTAIILSPQYVAIGDRSRIDAFTLITGSRAGVSIGRHVHIAAGAYLFGGGGIRIDDFAGISSRAIIYSANDDYSGNFLTGPTIPEHLTNVTSAQVTIGRHVVVGAASIVLPGVTIGEGSAIGALSLVKADVDSFVIAAGNPLRTLRQRERHLLALEAQLATDEDVAPGSR